MSAVKALRIAPDGHSEVIHVVPELDPLQEAIGGGHLECVGLAHGTHVYIDEEGKLKTLTLNLAATALARALGWRAEDVLVGPAIFLGDGEGGEEADVPAAALYAWGALGGVPA